jgi:Flp pilus assembly protein TadB
VHCPSRTVIQMSTRRALLHWATAAAAHQQPTLHDGSEIVVAASSAWANSGDRYDARDHCLISPSNCNQLNGQHQSPTSLRMLLFGLLMLLLVVVVVVVVVVRVVVVVLKLGHNIPRACKPSHSTGRSRPHTRAISRYVSLLAHHIPVGWQTSKQSHTYKSNQLIDLSTHDSM